ncbi:ABC transporter ATP-binding protein [Zavarzinia compransoris]|uniref:Spermidine/putrescine import ATP-binding protein PotA n=1 Tax=Zavarzinia compransoris TaxID=1264899 RepID=A0A317E140_9PROT|nr:ABC transporter ATP-binding protein [Zavarzinia compransoris]PWR20797.1 polyamine ABC transporter ATP-binding protein [Zavarzinia compransoris]TDP44368.1 putrescine transport system ATP-binding protein [Zavarzinia compransoris]
MNVTSASRVPFEPWNDPQAKPYIRIVNVTKTFGDFVAVDNLTLDIYQREFFSLLGPSGCGKTTLLRMLAGFERPTAGRIELDGVDMSAVPPYERPVNMMFQSYALFPHMTVEDNIAFGLRQDGVPKEERARRVEDMLNLVQLTKFGKRKPHQLSGGQRQRVALARSLVKKPKMLLLDEPLGALDKKLREQTQFELMTIQEQVGITFVIVTHDQEEAMTVSSRIAVMNHGRIAQVATPAEIYEYPNSRYVAEFIGDVNVLEGRLAEVASDHVIITSAEADTHIYVDRGTSAASGATVWVAVRPEKIDVALTPPEQPEYNCIKGAVWDIGYLGNLTIYHVKLENGKKVTAAVANRRRLRDRPITWNDEVYLTWAPDSAVVLVS